MSIMKINGSVVNGLTLYGNNVVRILHTASGEVLWEKETIDYFYLQNETDMECTFRCAKTGSPTAPNLEYSTNGNQWTTADMSSTWTVPVPARGKIYLRGDNGMEGFNRNSLAYYSISMDVDYSAHGNVMSIQNYNTMDEVTEIPDYCFTHLFSGQLVYADDMNLGNVTTIGRSGCGYLFPPSTQTVPDFSKITTIKEYGCNHILQNNTVLTQPLDLSNLTTVYSNGCSSMYYKCTALQVGADLSKVSTVGSSCFANMYDGCVNLETVYTPNIEAWDAYKFLNWVDGAGSKVTGQRIMYFTNVNLKSSCISGVNGYGMYVKTLLPQPTPTVYELKIINELDGITYDVDGGDEIFLPNTYGDLGVIEVPGTASTITFHDAEPSKLRIIEFSGLTTGGRVDGYAIDLTTFDTTRQIHIYEH